MTGQVDYFVDAWTAVPEWAEMKAALATAQRAMTAITPQDHTGVVRRAASDRFRDGRIDVADLVDDLAAAAVRDSAIGQMKGIASSLATDFRAELDVIQKTGARAALARLRGHLEDLVDDLAAHAPVLAEVTTADEAIRAGSKGTSAWTALDELAASHDGIRSAQLRLTLLAAGSYERPSAPKEMVLRYGYVANAALYEPLKSELRSAHIDPKAPTPWARPGAASLHWVIRNGAQLWLPDLEDLEACDETHRRRVLDHAAARDQGLDPQALSDAELDAIASNRVARVQATRPQSWVGVGR